MLCDPVKFPSATRRSLLDFRAPSRSGIGAKTDIHDTFLNRPKWCGGWKRNDVQRVRSSNRICRIDGIDTDVNSTGHSSGGNRVVVVAVVVCGSGGGNVRGSKVTAGRQTSWDLGLSHACAMKKHEANQYLLDRARVRMCFVDFWTRINFVCE